MDPQAPKNARARTHAQPRVLAPRTPTTGLQVEWRQSVSAVAGRPDSTVTGFCFSLELEALCISLSTGELLLLNVGTQQLEEVGAVEGGIMALRWSPDGEVFAAISGTGNILLMDQVRAARGPLAQGMQLWQRLH